MTFRYKYTNIVGQRLEYSGRNWTIPDLAQERMIYLMRLLLGSLTVKKARWRFGKRAGVYGQPHVT